MSESKAQEIINKLFEKTKQKKAIWDVTSSEEQFVLNLGNSSITIEKWYDEHDFSEYYTIIMRGDNGQIVYHLTPSNSEFDETYEQLKKLFEIVNSSYYKIDETLDDILEKLSSNNIIGKKDTLPF